MLKKRLKIYHKSFFLLEWDLNDPVTLSYKSDRAEDLDLIKIRTETELEAIISSDYTYDQSFFFTEKELRHIVKARSAVFCLFGKKKMAAVVVTAENDSAKCQQDFFPRSMCAHDDTAADICNAKTHPDFRGRGLYPHLWTIVQKDLKARGFQKSNAVCLTDNISSLRGLRKTAPKVYAVQHYFRKFRLSLYWERKVKSEEAKEIGMSIGQAV